jgi:tryptophanyl-tRNA synthetase
VPGNGLGFGFYSGIFEKMVQSKSDIFFPPNVKIHKIPDLFKKMSKSIRKLSERPLFEPPEVPE